MVSDASLIPHPSRSWVRSTNGTIEPRGVGQRTPFSRALCYGVLGRFSRESLPLDVDVQEGAATTALLTICGAAPTIHASRARIGSSGFCASEEGATAAAIDCSIPSPPPPCPSNLVRALIVHGNLLTHKS